MAKRFCLSCGQFYVLARQRQNKEYALE